MVVSNSVKPILFVGTFVGQRETATELAQAGYGVLQVKDSDAGLKLLRKAPPRLIMVAEAKDIEATEQDIQALKSSAAVPLVMIGSGNESSIVRTILVGADGYLRWPAEPALVLSYVKALFRREPSLIDDAW